MSNNGRSILAGLLSSALNSFALDYVARQSVGGTHLNFFILKQLPVPAPYAFYEQCKWDTSRSIAEWKLPAFLELTYTALDIAPFARDLGFDGPPFRWDEHRRFLLRCELDAAFFYLYGIERGDVDYIMETFPIVKRKDEEEHSEYRTKRVILEIYDEMQKAIETGVPYQTRLDPPPANGWTPPEELLQAAFASATTYAPTNREPAVVREESAEYELVPPPSTPKPMKDKDGEILRVRVYDENEQDVLNRGVAVGREKRGESTVWKVLAEGETEARSFVCPPFVLKRLKATGA